MKKYILGVKIDDVTMKEAVGIVTGWLSKSQKRYIVTPNPEFIVAAEEDYEFKEILKTADLSIPDGVGLNWFGGIKNRVPGVDFMEKLIAVAEEKGFTVGFLGGQKGVAEKLVEHLRKKYPKLKISYALEGPVIPARHHEVRSTLGVKAGIYTDKQSLRSKDLKDLWIPDQVRDDKGTDLLFVAFGHGKQEKWIASNLRKIPVKVAMGVGGSFNYLSGQVPRAPKLVRDLGFEWLYRLILQPSRIKRQLSLFKYLWLLMLH